MAEPTEDNFSESGEQTPAANAIVVNPGVTVLPKISRSIYVGGDGNLIVTMAGVGGQITFANVVAGMVYPLRVDSIDAGTTATFIVAIY